MSQDVEHLRLLSIFHYILAGLAGLCSFFPAIYLVMGIAMLSGWIEGDKGGACAGCRRMDLCRHRPDRHSPYPCVRIPSRSCRPVPLQAEAPHLLLRRGRTVAPSSPPLGTALGVFTIIVLMRDSVRLLFEPGAPEGSGVPGV